MTDIHTDTGPDDRHDIDATAARDAISALLDGMDAADRVVVQAGLVALYCDTENISLDAVIDELIDLKAGLTEPRTTPRTTPRTEFLQ